MPGLVNLYDCVFVCVCAIMTVLYACCHFILSLMVPCMQGAQYRLRAHANCTCMCPVLEPPPRVSECVTMVMKM